MKTITILQPQASLIACGAEKIETRSWATKYRGPIAIHDGKGEMKIDFPEPIPRDLPYGAVIAIADLVDCTMMDSFNFNKFNEVNGVWLTNGDFVEENELEFGDYTPGRYAWILANVIKSRHDRRLRNTKLLLDNYSLLQDHCKNAIYDKEQAIAVNAIDVLDSIDNCDNDTYIESIKKSTIRLNLFWRTSTKCLNCIKVIVKNQSAKKILGGIVF